MRIPRLYQDHPDEERTSPTPPQRPHGIWYEDRLQPAAKKVPWTEEETALVARKEAQLTIAGSRILNMELASAFPNRTLEAIKGKRRQKAYRDLVVQYIAEERGLSSDPGETEAPEDRPDVDECLLQYITSLPPLRDGNFNSTELQRICDSLGDTQKDATVQRLALYLLGIFPPRRHPRGMNKKDVPTTSKRKNRRREYAMSQHLWRKDRRRCIQGILCDTTESHMPPRDIMEPYWREVFLSTSDACPAESRPAPAPLVNLWGPITPEDVRLAKPSTSTAAGPDGLSARQLRALPVNIITRILNIILWCRKLPEHLLESRTTFLPKKHNAVQPNEFRPISIPSVLTRMLHKILVKRLAAAVDIDQRQRAFTNTDGCRDNVFLLDAVLRYHHKKYKPLFLASLDVSKAFDSVSHRAIIDTLRAMNIPPPMIEYMEYTYQHGCTRLEGSGWSSDKITPMRGVRQGDPLSPVIFNMVTHRLLQLLPKEIGIRMGDTTLNAAAFADDLILFASTPRGLQDLIDTTNGFLSSCGMTINADKSLTVGIKTSPKEKKTAIDYSTTFHCGNRQLPPLRRSEEWIYLGIRFSAVGKRKCVPSEIIGTDLEALTKAPLKPQQRLFALKHVVIPKTYYHLALGNVTIGQLNKTDRMIREAIRKWINLPHDVTTAYFHADIKDGGLGIPALRWVAPLQRLNRLLTLRRDQPNAACATGTFLQDEIDACKKRLTDRGLAMNKLEDIHARWANILHQSVDGSSLKDSAKIKQQHRWIGDGTRFLTGRDYVNCCRIRIGALPTKSRTARGRHVDRNCRAGCFAPETLNHVLQVCHRTHAARINRHNAIVSYLSRNLKRQGYSVLHEPRIATTEGGRKPDLVASMGQTSIIIDAQVVSEQADLERAHRQKTGYYADNRDVDETIKQITGATDTQYISATLSWRGIWSATSANNLRGLGLITAKDISIISTRVLIGGLAAFRTFNGTTAIRTAGRIRAGIG